MTTVRGVGGGGDWLKEGEGISSRRYMMDPWTWTMVCGLTMGGRGGLGGRGKMGKFGTTVIK